MSGMCIGGFPDDFICYVSTSDSGYMTQEIFFDVMKSFVHYSGACEDHPQFLFFDG
jgi:hypothetical protein